MSSTYNIGRSAKDISIGQRAERYTQVVVRNEDGKEYSAGPSDGAKLVVECPWASDDMAQSLLSKIGGIEYRPFTATGAYVNPLAELGDTISVSGMQSAILSQDINFNSLLTSTVSAPGEEELEHEYEYTPKIERKLSRGIAGAMQATKDGLLEAHNGLVAALNRQDGAPEDLAAGIDNYVRYDLKSGESYATSELFSKIGDKAIAVVKTEAWLDANGNARSLAQIVADIVEVSGRVNLSDVAYVNPAHGDQSGGLGVRGSIVNNGNIVSSGDLYLTEGKIHLGEYTYSGKTIKYIDEDSQLLVGDTSLGSDATITFNPGGATGRITQAGGFYYWDLFSESYQKVYVGGVHATSLYTGGSAGSLVVAPTEGTSQTITTRTTLNYEKGHIAEGRFLMVDGTIATQNFAFDMEDAE